MSERLRVDAPATLFAFLAERLGGWSRNTIRQRLTLGCVEVEGEVVRRGDHVLEPGETVVVSARGEGRPRARRAPLPTLFADDALIAIDKPAGLLSVSTGRSGERSALSMVRDALSRPGRPAALWPVHRIDRETSGVLLFARTQDAREAVQAAWSEVRKTYLAVVFGAPEPAEGAIELPLSEDREGNVHVGAGPHAKRALTRYRTLEHRAPLSLLEVRIETGRRHQIRAHLARIGHGLVGDDRYGVPGARLGLHAQRLELRHPRDGRALVLEAPPPRAFLALLPGR